MRSRASRAIVHVLLLESFAIAATITLPQNGRVSRIIDGDTLVVKDAEGDHTVRLIGVDAPEAHPSAKLDADASLTKKDKETILALGKRSADFTVTLCADKVCRLEYDKAHAERGYRDAYARLLVYLWIKDAHGKPLLFNAELIRQGYARALTDHPFDKDYKDTFTRLQQEARVARRGIWGKTIDIPWPKLSEAAFVGNKASRKYHRPTCNAVERMSPGNRVEFATAADAKAAGYDPCKTCKP